RAQIASGELPIGSALPTHKQLAEQHGIAASTAHRVTALLSSEGLVEVSRGRRAIVIQRPPVEAEEIQGHAREAVPQHERTTPDGRAPNDNSGEMATPAPQLWAITARGPDGRRYPVRHVCEDINKPDSFRPHLLAIARMEQPGGTDRGESWIGDYELEIREPGKESGDPKFTLRWQ
ncbi:MAG TPA: GntR family transcriptional regulator, partial [Pseudonocardiaceae bacterium]|nr:GntR family transcriptional regulator [Pseudonocardiaceae bacterium]